MANVESVFETVKHGAASGCTQLAKKQYMIRHDKMWSRIHWDLHKKFGIEFPDKWFDHLPRSVCSTNDGSFEIYWDRKIEVGKGLEHNKPDLIVVDKVNKNGSLLTSPYLGMLTSRRKKLTKLQDTSNLQLR